MIIAIAKIYHITIVIIDVTNDFQNTLRASSEKENIDFPPHYLSWFKLIFHNISREPTPNGRYVMEIFCGMQGKNLLSSSGIKESTWSYPT